MVFTNSRSEPDYLIPDVNKVRGGREVKEGPNVWMAVSGAAMAVGAFLPWITLGIISVPGTSGDGVFLIVGGLIVGALGLIKKRSTGIRVGAMVASILAGLVVLNTAVNVANLIAETDPTFLGSPSLGTGLILSGAGCLSALVSGFAD